MQEYPELYGIGHVCLGYRGPAQIFTGTDETPFLAISQSLGALWSYDVKLGNLSAEPDVMAIPVVIAAISWEHMDCEKCLAPSVQWLLYRKRNGTTTT
jgi:hypothetical protein